MSRGVLARYPLSTIRYNYATGNITTTAWVAVTTSLPSSAVAVEIFDASGAILKMSDGAAGVEDNSLIPYSIIPGGSAILLPMEIFKSRRLSLKAIDRDATTGYLVMNFFG